MKSIPTILQGVVTLVQLALCAGLVLAFARVSQIRQELDDRESIQLRDGKGNVLRLTPCSITMLTGNDYVFALENDDSLGTLLLHDRAGRVRCQLRADDRGGSLRLVGVDHSSQVFLGTARDTAEIQIFNGSSPKGALVALAVHDSAAEFSLSWRGLQKKEGLGAKSQLLDKGMIRSTPTIALEDGAQKIIVNR